MPTDLPLAASLRLRPLAPLFAPRSVAVVGASRRPESIGAAVVHNLVAGGFQGPVYPVNLKATYVHSLRAYPTLEALPEVPDLVVVTVPATGVLEVIRAAARLKVPAACVLTAGFAEVGDPGRAREQEMVAIARAAKMHVLGPNCLGLQNADPAVRLDATFASTFPADGPVAFASQSGALGLAALDYADELGLGFSAFASLGNKAELSANDLLDYWESDPRTRVVLLYLESLGNPTRFREIATRMSRHKPIVMVKSGRSQAGARAATSHTGAMAGPDSAIDALCAQSGVIRADTVEELFDIAMVLANQPLPKGRRIGVVTNAGGPGILAADAIESSGLNLGGLTDATKERLRHVLRPEASVHNPVDVLADAGPEAYQKSLEAVLADPGIDAVLALYVPPSTSSAPAMAQALVAAAEGSSKPVVSCFMGSHGVPESLRCLRQGRIPSFRFPEGAARSLAKVADYTVWRETRGDLPGHLLPTPPSALKVLAAARLRLGPAGGWLSGVESELLCRAWDLDLVSSAHTRPEPVAAADAADHLGYPVVLKAERQDLIHKSEAGAVVVGLRDRDEVLRAAQGLARLEPERLLVQRCLTGEEWLVGSVRDSAFGALVTVGAGGVRTELWQDVERRLAPLSASDRAALLDHPRIGQTWRGWRGHPAGDREALGVWVERLSHLAVAHPEVLEVEANPVVVMPRGAGVAALDVRVRLGPQS